MWWTSELLCHERLICSVQGFRDLVWLPIEQYRKDGRIVRGFQRGTASFGTSTAMAALELTNRMVRTIQVGSPFHWTIKSGFRPIHRFSSQAAAETAYDMVSPVPDERDTKRVKRYIPYGLAHQPVDLREGVAKAYTVVKEVKLLWVSSCFWKPELFVKTWWCFTLTGHYRYGTDHLWHSHQGARTTRDDWCSGRSSPPAATGRGQAAHHGHWGHL